MRMGTAVGIVAAGLGFGQGQAANEFDVASIRLNTLDDRIVTIDIGPGGRFAVRGYTLVLLMQQAYGVMDWNVTGGPSWIRTDRFDVTAKATVDGNLTEARLRPMLQRLLAERFKLTLHKESKEMSGYALVIGKGGPKIKHSVSSEEHPETFRMNRVGLSVEGITMADFARYVGGKVGVVAVDKTGLKGVYDAKADWNMEPEQYTGSLPGVDPREAFRATVLATLQARFGLKLTPQKIAVQMLAVDGVERPTAN